VELFNKVGEKAKGLQGKAKELGDMAREVTRKSGELLEVTKMKFELAKMEKEMENNLAGLGTLTYQKYRGSIEVEAEIERLLQSTAKLEDDMKSIQQQIEKLQPKPLVCPKCNFELPDGGKFCCFCGSKVSEED